MPIRVKEVSGKPNIDEVPKGYTVFDWYKIEDGYIVLIK